MAVQVILRDDVPHLGKIGEVVRVKPGYARNFLLPRGLAVEASPKNLRTLEHHKRVIAVHDDVDLEPGRVRIRRGGRAGGNRGVESLMAALGDPGFLRVKIGVGRPPAGPVPPSWVLSVPPAEELAALAAAEERAADAVELLVTHGPERAMNRINQKEAPHGGPPL